MQLGVKTGMVRAKLNCLAGNDAFTQNFKKISSENDPNDVLKEWFVKHYLSKKFTKSLSQEDQNRWIAKYKKFFNESVNESLIEGMGRLHNST